MTKETVNQKKPKIQLPSRIKKQEQSENDRVGDIKGACNKRAGK
jgi:hypothetical protein